jgi:hypothetical protein
MQGQQPNPAALAEHLKSVAEWESRNIEPYDKAILTLSSGALALSLTFSKDLVAPELAQANVILYLSWILFVLSLGTNIYAFLNTLRTIPKHRAFLDDVFKHCKKTPADYEEFVRETYVTIEVFNTCQGIFFLCGMLAFTTYVIINYQARICAAHHAPVPTAITAQPPAPTLAPASSPPIKNPTP